MRNDTLYIDIETVPSIDPTIEDLKAPGSYKKQESINTYIESNKDALMKDEVKKRSVSIYESKIVCLSYAWGNEKPQAISGIEKEIIRRLGVVIDEQCRKHGGSPEGKTIVGHNIKKFDAPIIWLRACLYNVPTVSRILHDKRKLVVDTMELSTCGIYGQFVSLDKMLKFFGLGSKGDITGADVYPMWKAGKVAEICKYCNEDVSKTRKLHKKLAL